MTTRTLTDTDFSTLANICLTAAERYSESAKIFRQMIDAPAPQPDELFAIRGEQARRLAEQFETQAREARNYAALLSETESASLIIADDVA